MRRPQKLLVTFLVLATSAGLIAWNTSAEAKPAMGVADAKRAAAALGETTVAVRGAVLEGSIVTNGTLVESFVLADGSEQLRVVYNMAPPDNFGPKDVVVNGILRTGQDGSVQLEGRSIQVGCSSKY